MQDEIKSVDAEQQGKQECSRDNRIPIGVTGRVREHRKRTLVFDSLTNNTNKTSKSEKRGMLFRFGAVRIICARHLWWNHSSFFSIRSLQLSVWWLGRWNVSWLPWIYLMRPSGKDPIENIYKGEEQIWKVIRWTFWLSHIASRSGSFTSSLPVGDVSDMVTARWWAGHITVFN